MVTNDDTMTIGEFAKLAGLTASALRFYDDAGVLAPQHVDPVNGYRLYSEAQLPRAERLRQLREIGMPLRTVGEFFDADADEALRLLDEQVAAAATEADRIRQAADALRSSLTDQSGRPLGTLSGPILASAIEQVLIATIADPDLPVLGGVLLEVDAGGISLTATDRYLLATRTLVPRSFPDESLKHDPWAATVSGDDLRSASTRLRRSPDVTLEAVSGGLGLRLSDGSRLHCRQLNVAFPDYVMMLDSLAPVTHRATLGKRSLLRALESQDASTLGLRCAGGQIVLVVPGGEDMVLEGSVTGADLTLWFEHVTWYPALRQAIGDDVLLDLRGADQPATVRSADDGDLTALVMPRLAPTSS